MTETNFDRHLAKRLKDPAFAEQFKKAGEEWDIAQQLAELRQQAGLSQSQLARKLKTSQQQISRLESANYEGHSLSMLRRVAEVLNAKVVVSFQTLETTSEVNETQTPYVSKKSTTKTRKVTPPQKTNKKTNPSITLGKSKPAKNTKNPPKKAATKRVSKLK